MRQTGNGLPDSFYTYVDSNVEPYTANPPIGHAWHHMHSPLLLALCVLVLVHRMDRPNFSISINTNYKAKAKAADDDEHKITFAHLPLPRERLPETERDGLPSTKPKPKQLL